MKTHIVTIFFITQFFSLILISCHDNDNIVPINRTIIVYMAADNDLSDDAFADIEEMKQGFLETGVNLLVFVDLSDEPPSLLKIEKGKETLIKTYPELNSAHPETLAEITREIINLYPAKEYGLILWSHGTSWLPAGRPLRAFGKDSSSGTTFGINLPELAEALPVTFDFILMDACLMGSVEVAYELRNKTNFIIASSTETIYKGFPYDMIIPELIKPKINFKSVAQHYFDYYNNMSDSYRSASISLIDVQEMDALAVEMKNLMDYCNMDFYSFDRTSVQRLDVYSEQYHFDLLDFVNKAFPDVDKSAFERQLNMCVLYKAATPRFIEMYDIDTYCGLSCYIPFGKRTDLNDYYKTLQWNKDCGILQQ